MDGMISSGTPSELPESVEEKGKIAQESESTQDNTLSTPTSTSSEPEEEGKLDNDKIPDDNDMDLLPQSHFPRSGVDLTRAQKMWLCNHDQVLQLTNKQIAECRRAFLLFDTNDSGTIDSKKLSRVMRLLGHNPTEAQVKSMIMEVDANGNDVVDFEEFEHLMAHIIAKPTSEEEVREMYTILDNENKGFITPTQLRQVMMDCGVPLTDKDVKKMVKIADLDRDGKIGMRDFMTYAKTTLDRFKGRYLTQQ